MSAFRENSYTAKNKVLHNIRYYIILCNFKHRTWSSKLTSRKKYKFSQDVNQYFYSEQSLFVQKLSGSAIVQAFELVSFVCFKSVKIKLT